LPHITPFWAVIEKDKDKDVDTDIEPSSFVIFSSSAERVIEADMNTDMGRFRLLFPPLERVSRGVQFYMYETLGSGEGTSLILVPHSVMS